MTQAERLRADRIVVGGGVMGLAAAAELGRRGASVLLLERFEPHHERGASHGATRNFNNAYAEADYLDLFAEARGRWRRLEAETGRALLDLNGLVTHGPDETVAAIHAALLARDARVELVSAAEAGRRWPGMRFAGEALVGLDAGVVRAAEALDCLSEAAAARGAELRYGHRVVGIDAVSDERVAVTAETGSGRRILAETTGVVVAAGAWSAPLLGGGSGAAGLDGTGFDGLVRMPELTVTEEHPAHFRVRDAGLPWPSFNHIAHDAELERRGGHDGPLEPRGAHDALLERRGAHVYGMVTPGEGVKVGFHAVGETVDPDRRPFGATEAKRRQLRAYVAEWFPGLDPDSAAEISCTYTSTASGDFVLDRVGPVTVGAGFSGHGFKFAPAVGRILADASLGLDAPPDRFRLAAHGVRESEGP